MSGNSAPSGSTYAYRGLCRYGGLVQRRIRWRPSSRSSGELSSPPLLRRSCGSEPLVLEANDSKHGLEFFFKAVKFDFVFLL